MIPLIRELINSKQEQIEAMTKRIADLEAENKRLREILHVDSDWVFLQSLDDEPINQPPKEQS